MLMMVRIISLIALLSVTSCTSKEEARIYPVFGKDALHDISLLEESDEAFTGWAEQETADAVLVHAGPYGSLKVNSSSNIQKLADMMKKKQWDELSRSRGRLFHHSNYLFTSARLGMVKKIYWILPYGFFVDIPLAGDKVRNFLKTEASEFSDSDIEAMVMESGCLKGLLSGVDIHICSPRTLPRIVDPVIMSIDTGFFPVYAAEHKLSKLRALKWYYDFVSFKQKLRIDSVHISYGVVSGHTEPIHRYIGDELYEGLKDPEILKAESPPSLWKFRDRADNMFSGGEDTLVREYLNKEPLEQFSHDPALRLLHAAATVRLKEFEKALHEANDLCQRDAHYCYGFVFLANLIEEEKHDKWRKEFLKRAEETVPDRSALIKNLH